MCGADTMAQCVKTKIVCGADTVAQCVKTLAAEPDGFNVILRTHIE